MQSQSKRGVEERWNRSDGGHTLTSEKSVPIERFSEKASLDAFSVGPRRKVGLGIINYFFPGGGCIEYKCGASGIVFSISLDSSRSCRNLGTTILIFPLISRAFIIILYPSYFSIFAWISKTKAKVLAMSQSTILLLPCANQNALEDSLVHFTVQNSFENYIFLKVAEVLVVRKWQKFSSFNPKVLTVYTRSLLTSKVSWARRQTKRVHIGNMQLK